MMPRGVWSDATFVAAAVLSVTWWIPQLVRSIRHGSAGVSAYTWAISTANFLLWASRSAIAGEAPVAAVELVQAAGSGAIVVCAGITRKVVLLAVAVAGLLAVTHVWDPLATYVAIIASFVVRLPQLWSLLRERTGAPNQVSGITWVMSTAANGCWVAWAVMNDHPYFATGSAIAMVMSIAIAAAARRTRGSGREADDPSGANRGSRSDRRRRGPGVRVAR
jgi:uncharacterized protein with PQ loop repeat